MISRLEAQKVQEKYLEECRIENEVSVVSYSIDSTVRGIGNYLLII